MYMYMAWHECWNISSPLLLVAAATDAIVCQSSHGEQPKGRHDGRRCSDLCIITCTKEYFNWRWEHFITHHVTHKHTHTMCALLIEGVFCACQQFSYSFNLAYWCLVLRSMYLCIKYRISPIDSAHVTLYVRGRPYRICAINEITAICIGGTLVHAHHIQADMFLHFSAIFFFCAIQTQ